MTETLPQDKKEGTVPDKEKPAQGKNANRPMDSAYDADETAFLKEHRKASFWSSVFFAIAGATFIGVLNNLFGRLLNQSPATGKKSSFSELFTDKQMLGRMTGMMSFGAVCMYISNWLESKKTLLEWRMGGNKVSRKLAVADNQPDNDTETSHTARYDEADLAAAQDRADGKSWRYTVTSRPKQSDYELAR